MIDRIDKLVRDSGVPGHKVRRELAAACGITPQAVAQWYSGSTKSINAEYIAAIASRWNESTYYLITGKRRNSNSTSQEEKELIDWIEASPRALELCRTLREMESDALARALKGLEDGAAAEKQKGNL